MNLLHACTLPERDSREGKINFPHGLKIKLTSRVSYLHEVLSCASKKYSLNFLEDEKYNLDSDGSSGSEEEEEEEETCTSLTDVVQIPENITRSTTFDEATSKKVWEVY